MGHGIHESVPSTYNRDNYLTTNMLHFHLLRVVLECNLDHVVDSDNKILILLFHKHKTNIKYSLLILHMGEDF